MRGWRWVICGLLLVRIQMTLFQQKESGTRQRPGDRYIQNEDESEETKRGLQASATVGRRKSAACDL